MDDGLFVQTGKEGMFGTEGNDRFLCLFSFFIFLVSCTFRWNLEDRAGRESMVDR